MEGARVTSVISNHCIRTRLLVFKNFLAITVCVMRSITYGFLCVCLSPVSAVGQGLRPFVVYPPSCRGPYKNPSDTSPFHSRRQELPEDLPTQTPTLEYEQQWAPNTIQTIIMICNAKGIPTAIAQKL